MSMTIESYLADLGSSKPAPGGGSAAALTASMGAALGKMVLEVSSGKKSVAEYQEQIEELITRSQRLMDEFYAYMDKDEEAFSSLLASYREARQNPDNGVDHQANIQDKTRIATEVPLNLIKLVEINLDMLVTITEISAKSILADCNASAAHLLSAAKSSRFNALLNSGSLEDKELRDQLENDLEVTYSNCERLEKQVHDLSYERVFGK